METNLEAGRYVIVPCTWDAGVNTKFVLRLYSNNTVEKIEECAPSKDVTPVTPSSMTPVTAQPSSVTAQSSSVSAQPSSVAHQTSTPVTNQPSVSASGPTQSERTHQAPRQSFLSQNRAPRTTSTAPQPTQQVTPVTHQPSSNVTQSPQQSTTVTTNSAEHQPGFGLPGPAKLNANTAQTTDASPLPTPDKVTDAPSLNAKEQASEFRL